MQVQCEQVRACYCKRQRTAVPCPKCGEPYHTGCINTCPSCVVAVMDPMYFVKGRKPSRLYSTQKEVFAQFDHIRGQKIEIRCIKVDKNNPLQQHKWPDICSIELNGSQIKAFQPLAILSALKKRKDSQFQLSHTPFLKKRNHMTLRVGRAKGSKFDQRQHRLDQNPGIYFFQVIEIEKRSIDQIVNQTRLSSPTIRLQKRELLKIFDCEPAPLTIVYSTKCPYSQQKITVPAVGSQCSHTQCFCMIKFLELMESQRKWNCPYCNLVVRKFVINTYLEGQLKKFSQSEYPDKLQFSKEDLLKTDALDQSISQKKLQKEIKIVEKQKSNPAKQKNGHRQVTFKMIKRESAQQQDRPRLKLPQLIVIQDEPIQRRTPQFPARAIQILVQTPITIPLQMQKAISSVHPKPAPKALTTFPQQIRKNKVISLDLQAPYQQRKSQVLVPVEKSIERIKVNHDKVQVGLFYEWMTALQPKFKVKPVSRCQDQFRSAFECLGLKHIYFQ